jgi:drug/metabolite transporter (DMT)-like permease
MNFLELLVLAAIWGASFLFMRVATPAFGPFALIFLRVGIAALVLLPVMRTAAAWRQLRTHAAPLSVVGILNSAIPFCLFSYSTLYLDAGLDSILNAMTPLWTALMAAALFGVRLTGRQSAGLALGIAGVVTLVWDRLFGHALGTLPAILAVMLATLCYGFAANYSKRHLAAVAPTVVAFGAQFTSTIVLLPFALISWPRQAIPLSTWGCVAGLAVLCTGLAYVLYYRLIAHIGAAYAASVTFLIPIFGMLWGALFLGEHITPREIAGCGIILLGTALAGGKLDALQAALLRVSRPRV